jgi:hypothetical protein
MFGHYKLNQKEKEKMRQPSKAHFGPTFGGQNIPQLMLPTPVNIPQLMLPTPVTFPARAPRLSPATVRRPWLLSGRRRRATAPCPRFAARWAR